MWVYFYVSKERVKQIALQAVPLTLAERINKWDVKGIAKGSVDAESAKLLEFLGVKGKASGSGEVSTSRISEKKFTPTDEAILEDVRSYIVKNENYVDLASIENTTDVNGRLLKFKGSFKPIVSGGSAAEKIASYEEVDYVLWSGKCGNQNVTFVTSKQSLISHSPVIQSILNEKQLLELEGFAVTLAEKVEDPIPILPLFFGIQIGMS